VTVGTIGKLALKTQEREEAASFTTRRLFDQPHRPPVRRCSRRTTCATAARASGYAHVVIDWAELDPAALLRARTN
jgi:hypothetical protein